MHDIAHKKPKTVDDFQLEEIDGEVLLYSPKATRSIYLNPSASLIWRLCTGEFSTQEIIDSLREQFPDQAETIADDVMATLDQFVESQAVELVEPE
ncbi:MAG: PqqD family protein [Proteobacteria bacterium]|nr:PqqD family protein [Pseudomonadota bacterium]